MTREEAIKLLICEKTFVEDVDGNIGAERVRQAYDMAIEALSAEQKEEELAKDIARRMATIIENEQDMRVILKNASAEPTDLISKADALDIIAFKRKLANIDGRILLDETVDRINALQPATIPTKCIAEIKIDADEIVKRIKDEYEIADRPSGEWIPCSEKLPEDGQAVIICTDDKRFKNHPVGTCTYEHGRFHTNFHDDISTIAWMPLPKPYCPNCGAKMGGNK